jgi:hypothetical protein
LGLFNFPTKSTWDLLAWPIAAIVITCTLTWLFEWAIQDHLDAWRRKRFYAKHGNKRTVDQTDAEMATTSSAIDPVAAGRYGA